MFTLQQIRNITFSLLNASTLAERMRISEKKIVNVHKSTIHLDEVTKQNKFEAHTMNEETNERITKFRDEWWTTKSEHETIMRDMKKKVNAMEKMIITNKEHINQPQSWRFITL